MGMAWCISESTLNPTDLAARLTALFVDPQILMSMSGTEAKVLRPAEMTLMQAMLA
jgi:hypothetical protein